MTIKKKWNELDKTKRIMVGIGSAVAVATVMTGCSTGQPAQTKVADTTQRTDVATKDTENKDKEKDKLDGKDKESEDVKTDGLTKAEDKDGKEEKKDVKEDEKVKESITKKEDGTKVEVKQSSGATPSATVKVERKAETNKVETKKAETKAQSKPNVQSKPKVESKPQVNKTPPAPSTSKPVPSKPVPSKPVDIVTTKTTTATESIGFKTTRQNDSSLDKGKEVVSQNGQNGVRTITYKETYTNGKLTSKTQVSSSVTKNPVDKIVKVGTKAPQPAKPTYQSAAQAHSILSGSGMKKAGNTYALSLGLGTDVRVTVGGNHVTAITYNADAYIPWKNATLQELQEIFGDKEGKEIYDFSRSQAALIEKAVRAAANAVYGSGTSQANSLYNQIISSKGTSKSF